MLEARTYDNRTFRIFCMKESDYAMNIMENWMTLDDLEGARTRRYFTPSSSTKWTNKFTY